MYRYFEWVNEVQDILKEIDDKLVHQETAVHDIMNIKDPLQWLSAGLYLN